MADQQPIIIIIKKKKKGGHAGHHGGAWKVAYADFVTAMMSFFLLLWLLNVTTAEQRRGIADYFAPASISKSESGSGSVFGGQSVSSDKGAEIQDHSAPSTQQVTIPTVGQGDEGDEETPGKSEESPNGKKLEGNDAKKPNNQGSAEQGDTAMPQDPASVAKAMQSEEDAFKNAEQTLKEAILSSSELKGFANQIVIDRTPEGLRIQIIDRDKFSMFPSASAIPYERARDLLMLVGKVIARLPNKISVTGHTDSTPFTAGSGRDNWSLSTERANTSREYLVKAGVEDNHIARISGLADRDPFVADSADSRNRRISIVLLRQALAPALGAGQTAPSDAAKK